MISAEQPIDSGPAARPGERQLGPRLTSLLSFTLVVADPINRAGFIIGNQQRAIRHDLDIYGPAPKPLILAANLPRMVCKKPPGCFPAAQL